MRRREVKDSLSVEDVCGMAHIILEQHVNMGIVIVLLALYSVRGQRPVTCMVKKSVQTSYSIAWLDGWIDIYS